MSRLRISVGSLLALVWIVGQMSTGSAADVLWSNSAGGLFSDGANWTGGAVPLVTDNALFDLGSAGYTVSFDTDATNDQLLVANDNLTLDLAGFTYSQSAQGVTKAVVVGKNLGDIGALTLTNGTLAPGSIAIGKTGSTGQLTVSTGATVDAGSTVSGSFVTVGDGGIGTLDVVNGGHLIGGAIINSSGTVNITGPISSWTGSTGGFTTINGALNINNGGKVTNRSSGVNGTVILDGVDSTWTMGGPFSGGQLSVGAFASGFVTVQNGGTLSTSGGLLGVTGAGVGVVTVTGAGSRWDLNGNLVVGSNASGALNILDGGVLNSTNFVSIATENSALVNVDGPGSTWTHGNSMVVGAGEDVTMNVTNGGSVSSIAISLGSAFDRADRAADITVSGGGANMHASFSMSVGGFHIGLTNVGVGPGGSMISDNQFRISTGATVDLTGGTITVGVGSAETTPNTVRVYAGGALDMANLAGILNAGTVQVSGGKLAGIGQVNANVQNDGIVSPGVVAGFSGTLPVGGNYSQGAGGTLQIDLRGLIPDSDYDVLDITGLATLGGSLDVSLAGGFSPGLGDSFEILKATSGLSGTFSTENLPTLASGLLWNVNYDTVGKRVLLEVQQGFTADFDGDGDVDAADLVVWQSSYAIGAGADADGDGDSDGADFIAWQQQLTGPAPLADIAIPEPSTLILLLSSLVLGLYWIRTPELFIKGRY